MRNMLFKAHTSILENTFLVENLESFMDVSKTVRLYIYHCYVRWSCVVLFNLSAQLDGLAPVFCYRLT